MTNANLNYTVITYGKGDEIKNPSKPMSYDDAVILYHKRNKVSPKRRHAIAQYVPMAD